MSRSSSRGKVLTFGLLGALGCLAGSIAGEPLYFRSTASTSDTVVITRAPKEPPPLLTPTKKPAPPPVLPPALSAPKRKEPSPPPPELKERLDRYRAKEGYIEISLIWDDFTDLDLHCTDPFGEEIYFSHKKADRSTGELDVDKNLGNNADNWTRTPIEHIYFNDKAPPGHYKVHVVKFSDHEDGKATRYTVDLKIGEERKTYPERKIGEAEKQLVCEFDVLPPQPALEITASPNLVVDQGGKNTIRLLVGRANLKGPVTIKVEGELKEISATSTTLPETDGPAEATIEVSAEEFATGGPRKLNVIAESRGLRAESPVDLTVNPQPEEIRLSAPSEIAVARGGNNTLKLVVARDHYVGPIKVRCEDETDGLESSPVTIEPNDSDAEFRFNARSDATPGLRKVRLIATGGSARAIVPVELTVEAGAPSRTRVWSWSNIAKVACWTALLALGLSLLLSVGQDHYLGRSPLNLGTIRAGLGGLIAGAVAGGGAQLLVQFLSMRSVGGPLLTVLFVMSWLVLGWLLGRGIGLFIPNLKPGRAAIAGAVGGGIGVACFLAIAPHGETLSRFAGATILGLAIGSMVALAEVIFRKNWLEVRFGGGEVRLVNLGDAPISIGSDSRACAVWTPGAPPVALTYTLRDGYLSCADTLTGKVTPVSPGESRRVGSLEIVACGSGVAEVPFTIADPPTRPTYRAPSTAPAPPPFRAPSPAPAPPPFRAPSPAPAPPPFRSPAPAPPPLRSPAPAPPPFRSPPMPPPRREPVSPPMPAQSRTYATPSRPPTPPVPPPRPQFAPPPVRPPLPPTRPSPPPTFTPEPSPMVSPLAAPAVPTSPVVPPSTAPAVPPENACPTCGRFVPGSTGARYCLICDQTF
jgi:hypothetical protein